LAFDFRKIEYFLAVIEHANISNAAEALRVSQPTLSRQIHALEEQFKTPLFVRHGRGVIATEAGRRLHEGVRGLEHRMRALRDDVTAAAEEPTGAVALGIPPSPRTLLAASIIKSFCDAYPKVALRIREHTSGEIRDLLARGELDLAILNEDESLHGLAFDALVTEPLLLVGPASAKLSLSRESPLSLLGSIPLILTSHPNSLRRIVELQLHQFGKRPQIRVEVDTLPLITDLVQQGLGYTVLPSCSVLSLVKAGKVSASPLAGARLTWTIARQQNRGLSVGAHLLTETVRMTIFEFLNGGKWPLARLHPDCHKVLKRAGHRLSALQQSTSGSRGRTVR
jgi:LysR family transcriptional regulator, nitrogen assimilation regulatory protein